MIVTISTILVLAVLVSGKKYCRQDSDCDSLGDLYCIKSACDWGVCSCPRGKAAKFLGSGRKFQCVPLKKIDESCSNAGDKGVCGAYGSYCDEGEKECRCRSGLVPIWGGEMCASETAIAGTGETCGAGSLGTCNDGTKCMDNSNYIHSEVQTWNLKPVCACANSQKMIIPNFYSNNLYVGKMDPMCTSRQIGDQCLKNTDCPGYFSASSNVECKDNVCACKATFVPDYQKSSCKKPLAFGTKCHSAGGAPSDSHCDGSIGLVCGDMCTLTDVASADLTCTCGPYHTMSGSTCSAIGKGGSCRGDMNCKGFSENGVCIDGTCQNGAVPQMASLLFLLTAALASKILSF